MIRSCSYGCISLKTFNTFQMKFKCSIIINRSFLYVHVIVSSDSISTKQYLELQFTLQKVRVKLTTHGNTRVLLVYTTVYSFIVYVSWLDWYNDEKYINIAKLFLTYFCFYKGSQLDLNVVHDGYRPPGGLNFSTVEISGLSVFPYTVQVDGVKKDPGQIRLRGEVSRT